MANLPQVAAVAAVLADPMFSIQVGPSCTCSEAETFADLLIAFGFIAEAQTWLYGHSTGDEDTDDHFEMQEPGATPPVCILTGADGENADDCTTHDHEEPA